MADVFRVHESTTNGSPFASTSHSTLDVDEADGAGPSLAQLLQETVRESARRGLRTSSSKSRNGASKIDSHAPLPSLPSLTSPSSRAYISSLLSKDLPALLKEPDELSRQSELLDGDLATLCYKSIGELLSVGECVDGVEDGFERMQGALDSLLSCTDLLSSSCTHFTISITPIIESRTRLNLVRNNIASIEDILSIPRLVSTCIRSGWWSEAVDLAFRARELEDILKGPTAQRGTVKSKRSLLGKVRADVEDELETLRSRIIEGLRGRGLKLPSAVRSVALLRRLSTPAASSKIEGQPSKSLSEPELRLTFLISRWDCVRSQLEQLEMSAGSAATSDDRLRSVKRWIEVWREVVGETVTMYSEIFLTPTTSSTESSALDDNYAPYAGSQSYSPLALSDPSSPLIVFLSQAQGALTSFLQQQLPHISAASSLVSVQTQLAYCAAAFSKFGFDFRHIPNRAIAARLLEVVGERFDFGVETFRKELSRAFTLSGSRSGKPRLVINAMISAESWDSILALEESEISSVDAAKSSHPPAYIALFPPLAKIINNYSAALNELRLLPITNLYPTIVRALRNSLSECASYMVQFVQTALESQQAYPDDDNNNQASMETVILRKSSLVLSKCIIPWITWALDEIVYPDIDKARWSNDESDLAENLAKLRQLLQFEDSSPPGDSEDRPTHANTPMLYKDQPSASSSEAIPELVENGPDEYNAQITQPSGTAEDAEDEPASELRKSMDVVNGAENVGRVEELDSSAAANEELKLQQDAS